VNPVDADPVLEALDELVDALRINATRIEAAIARATQMRTERESGRSYRDIEADGEGPLLVALTSDNLTALLEKGSQLRRAEARALHNEGMTMDQIAEMFGVTRQRVSALLRQGERASRPLPQP
jgi:DNA-directed RNA polymerase specialized sigma24 family protein